MCASIGRAHALECDVTSQSLALSSAGQTSNGNSRAQIRGLTCWTD